MTSKLDVSRAFRVGDITRYFPDEYFGFVEMKPFGAALVRQGRCRGEYCTGGAEKLTVNSQNKMRGETAFSYQLISSSRRPNSY